MNKDKNIYGGLFVILFLVLCFLGFKSQANPLDILDSFHKIESPPAQDTEMMPSDSSEGSLNEEPSPSEHQKDGAFSLPSEVQIPFVIGYMPYTNQSLRVISNFEDYFMGVNVQMTPKEFKKFDVLSSWLSGVSMLDPILELGAMMNVYPQRKDFYFYAGFHGGVSKGDHSVHFKLQTVASDYKAVLENAYGRVSLFYSYEKRFPVGFASFYGGFVSPLMKVDFSNMEEFKANFKGLSNAYEFMSGGVFYQPSIASNYSFNLEISPNYYTLSINYFM